MLMTKSLPANITLVSEDDLGRIAAAVACNVFKSIACNWEKL